jgi:hypothetical protein
MVSDAVDALFLSVRFIIQAAPDYKNDPPSSARLEAF